MKKKLFILMSFICLMVCGIAIANVPSTECNNHSHTESCSQDLPRKPCRYCDGHGYIECNTCDGTGWRTCFSCGGEGKILRYNQWETCETCKGKGNFKCDYCMNGQRKCDACRGTGITQYVGQPTIY